MKTFSFESIGTKWQIDINDDISVSKLEKIKENVFSFLSDFSSIYSRFDKKSLITKISEGKGGKYEFPESSKEIFGIYSTLYELTDGLFTPLIGDTLSSAGCDRNYSLKPNKLKHPEKWSIMDFKYPVLDIKKPVTLDFGACGKGYAIDQIVKILNIHKISSFIVDGSGDLYLKNISNSKVGLENPLNVRQVIGVADVNNESICASALNRRTWGIYSHIINPRTLKSPENIIAVWTISKKAIIADALATALFLVEPEKLNEFKFEYLILHSDFKVKKSVKFPAEIYYN